LALTMYVLVELAHNMRVSLRIDAIGSDYVLLLK